MAKTTNSVVITGCSRGIGLELATQYAAAGWQVIATARTPQRSETLSALAQTCDAVDIYPLDVTDDASIAAFCNSLGGRPIDLLINNAGLYGTGGSDLGNLSRPAWREVLEVNSISPLMLTQALLGNLAAGRLKTVAMISSKMGSITDNSSGASYYYRSSKTALNQVVKSLSVDLAPQGIKVVALHPGWVQTDMGGANALIDVKHSAAGLRQLLAGLDEDKSGYFYNVDGTELAW